MVGEVLLWISMKIKTTHLKEKLLIRGTHHWQIAALNKLQFYII